MATFTAEPQHMGLRKEIKKLLGKRMGLLKHCNVFQKDAAPTKDTDLASLNGDLCYDTANGDLYVASSVTATTTTWTKIVD